MNNPYSTAKQQGYSDEEIINYMGSHPKYSEKIKTARDQGYSNEEISSFLGGNQKEKPKERSNLEKAGRIGSQFALGMAQGSPVGMAQDLGTALLRPKDVETVEYKQRVFEDIERLQEQKQTGVWDEKDEELLNHLVSQIKDPEKLDKFVNTEDIGVRGLAEKATGADLHPEGFLEKAANWAGFLKNPNKIKNAGLNPLKIIKSIAPNGTEALRGVGAGYALQVAEDGEFGPMGTIGAAIAGDLIGLGAGKVGKTTFNTLTKPKETVAKGIVNANKVFSSKDKLELQKNIIKDFREAGIQADLGSIVDNDLLRSVQTRLAQSSLTGKDLEKLRDALTNDIRNEYKVIADELGAVKSQSNHEMGSLAQNGLKEIRSKDLSETRKLYENAEKSLKEKSFVDSRPLAKAIENLEKQLKPGSIKSAEQQTVLSTLEKLKRDIYDSSGNPMYAGVKDLMNNKIGLNDIINYEVQGGAKQLLKGVVAELDRAIISHGKENPSFAKNYINANKRFSNHAKTFRNKNVDQMLRLEDPEKIMSKMSNVQGVRDMEKIFSKTSEGKKFFNDLKRRKLDDLISNKMVDSTTNQVKFGEFSKLLEKGKNKELVKELLGTKAFKQLEKLMKNSGRLANSLNKFYNASKSGSVAIDAAAYLKIFYDVGQLILMNPWPILKTGTAIVGAKGAASLLANPEFLKLVEEGILVGEKGTPRDMEMFAEMLKPYLKPFINQKSEENQPTR